MKILFIYIFSDFQILYLKIMKYYDSLVIDNKVKLAYYMIT